MPTSKNKTSTPKFTVPADTLNYWSRRMPLVFRGLGEEPTVETDAEFWVRLAQEHKERYADKE